MPRYQFIVTNQLKGEAWLAVQLKNHATILDYHPPKRCCYFVQHTLRFNGNVL